MTAAVFQMDVDIAVRRPPIPANTVTINSIVPVEDRPSITSMENEARTTAALMAMVWGPMVIDVRIVRAEL